ncbi:MAG TPA: HesA/MoeB/ThiF family protein [bacterium]|nr:HesA/MoeB/ThiF family protein [bacterium]
MKARILVVGVGGLGCPASLALGEAGVETLGLMDPDKVELSNLHRQILYSENDLGRMKVEAAADYLKKLFPKTQTILIPEAFTPQNAKKIFSQFDLIIDGLDRLEKKFILNDWCVKLGKPYVHAGVVKFEGQVLPVLPGKTACLRCLIPKIPPPFAMPTCQEAGVLGSFSQAIGYLQAHEALRLAEGRGPFRLWKVDLQKREARSIIPQRNPACGACGQGKVEMEIASASCEA